MLTKINTVDRKQMSDEVKLKKVLPESCLQRRRKVNNVNMKTTFICWLVEFIGSILMIFGPFVTGHRNVGWGVMQVLILTVYFILLPLTYLINSSESKNFIADSNWMSGIFAVFRNLAKVWKSDENKN